jgi:adenylate kinase
MNDRRQAVLLLGPTGSGKTPLGTHLEQTGLWGRRCLHFDFGAELRAAGGREGDDALETLEREVVRDSLRTGALLEDDHFPIALRILSRFLEQRRARSDDLVVLNGLPRHAGQASALAGSLEVRGVISLRCSPETVRERIRRDPAGDRQGRVDDDLEAIAGKLLIFEKCTIPLLDWYRDRGVQVVELQVGPDTLPADLLRNLADLPPPPPACPSSP